MTTKSLTSSHSILDKAVNILRQVRIALFSPNSYPSVYMFGYWQSYVTKDNKTKYNHWKTLLNYITDNKTK